MKIHIVGCSGAGKTYFADRLSEKYNIPHFDLDNLYWDNSADRYGVKRQAEERENLLLEVLRNENYIIEGVYYKWLNESFERADIIYVLDIPEATCRFRIVKRFVKRKLGIEKGKKETLKSLWGLLKWLRKYRNTDMPKIREILAARSDKVRYIHDSREMKYCLQQ